MAEWRRSSFSRSSIDSEYGAIDLDQPVGDPVDVVDALDVGPALLAEAPPQLVRPDERAQLSGQVVRRRRDDRHLQPEGVLGLLDRHRVAAYEPTIQASKRLRYSSSASGLPRMSAPRKCITDFRRVARRIGIWSFFGTSVR